MIVTHIYSFKNDGRWHQHSPLENAISEAKSNAINEHNLWDWDKITINKLPCDDSSHYPDLCYHYEVIIEGTPG